MSDLYEKLKRFKQIGANATDIPAPTDSSPVKQTFPEGLLNIPGVLPASKLAAHKQKREEEKHRVLATMGVETIQNETGSYGYRERSYPLHDLAYSSRDITPNELRYLTRDECLEPVEASDLLFIDTETTGLAGGAGTVPFLVGIGFFEERSFKVCQFLLRDYHEEEAMLIDLRRRVAPFKAVASYNGKTFDLPLLRTRYLLQRQTFSLPDYPHFDLLYPARRFWRSVLPDCSLGTVEEEILGHTRGEDIPGSLIPHVFFDFLRGVRIDRMRPVLSHNAEDVISLAMLAAKMCRLLSDPLHERMHAAELLAIARIMEGESPSLANHCLEHALLLPDLSTKIKQTIEKQLSLFYKRMERFDQAAAIWIRMADRPEDLFAHIELAKYYEHYKKQFPEALDVTERALQLMRNLSDNNPRNDASFLQALSHRRARLLRKLNRGS